MNQDPAEAHCHIYNCKNKVIFSINEYFLDVSWKFCFPLQDLESLCKIDLPIYVEGKENNLI